MQRLLLTPTSSSFIKVTNSPRLLSDTENGKPLNFYCFESTCSPRPGHGCVPGTPSGSQGDGEGTGVKLMSTERTNLEGSGSLSEIRFCLHVISSLETDVCPGVSRRGLFTALWYNPAPCDARHQASLSAMVMGSVQGSRTGKPRSLLCSVPQQQHTKPALQVGSPTRDGPGHALSGSPRGNLSGHSSTARCANV